jgi:hypothetical protein
VPTNCMGDGVAININHQDSAWAAEPTCSLAAPPNSYATCENGRCVTKPLH